MKNILIGSCRLKELYPDFPREPKDCDYATADRSLQSYSTPIGRVEYLYNPVLIEYLNGYGEITIDGDELLTLKVSHLFWDINWEKHLFDCQFLLSKGHVIVKNLFEALLEFWKEFHPTVKRSNLMMTKEDFFNNAVNEDAHQHDYLHSLLNPVPMFTKLLKEGSEVELDPNKWHHLTHKEKCAVVWEETCVMAFERYPTMNYKSAFVRQLKDNIIKHFPVYIALFAIENYKEIHITKIDYIKIIKNGVTENQFTA